MPQEDEDMQADGSYWIYSGLLMQPCLTLDSTPKPVGPLLSHM